MGSIELQANRPGSGELDVLLFGPQAVSFSNQSLSALREVLEGQSWAVDTLAELPSIYSDVSVRIPNLQSASADRQLADLCRWLTEGPPADEIGELPNIVLAPLTTLSHLLQYRRYIELQNDKTHKNGTRDDAHMAVVRGGRTATLGFCNGMLAAFAAASATSTAEWERLAANAVRLAALIGMAVDGGNGGPHGHGHGASESYGLSWRGEEQGRLRLDRILAHYPGDAYVSVQYDECRATVTVSSGISATLLQELRDSGITAAQTRLRGRYHSASNDDVLAELIRFCKGDLEKFAFVDAQRISLPTYSNAGDGRVLQHGLLHELALEAMLVQKCDWHSTLSAVVSSAQGRVVCLSNGPGVPPSLMRKLGDKVKHFGPSDTKITSGPQEVSEESTSQEQEYRVHKDDIAIVGMSVKVAGADDLAEFEEILRAGQSQHQEVPNSRVPLGCNPWRRSDEDKNRKWYGNFIRDADAFDHKFFRKSPRESAAMDPQQRLVLQAAYQAVEQSGYYSSAASTTEEGKHIGVYLGTCATDYDQNVSCHSAGAFTVTGLLRGFIAGRISHFFGWTGPSMTFDTACSGSAVAIHTAVRALRTGECTAALAGGVNTIGNEVWFQNLAGAQFLSPTGQCKPFDEKADGYCRGEGISCIMLKPMAAAIADGDQIFGRIASTAVYQNHNCTPIFVPNAPSLSRLFTDVIRQARLEPQDISLVEAHGTGTPVGDPAEYQSIRHALGGSLRRKPLSLGSVKGLLGHTESTSGIISLIKVILMMRSGFLAPQASHSKLSHRIDATSADMINVQTELQPWTENNKAALINNYGASGSNAAMVVAEAPSRWSSLPAVRFDGESLPFWISGYDARSIKAYCAKLAPFVESAKKNISLTDLCFNLSRQSNRTLPNALQFRCSSVDDFLQKISADSSSQIKQVRPARPVVLCFGGQSSTFIGLDPKVSDNVPLFRHHLEECDAVIQSLGHKSIFPNIYSKTPEKDTVHLQTMLFSIQYASARCWMDCGVPVKAVVGHSFGEITALCISETLSLKDAIILVAGRAAIVRDSWGSDQGVMVAVEGDLELVERLVQVSNQARQGGSPASIACYNSSQGFTLAGSQPAMDQITATLASDSEFAAIKSRKLNVTNAFHSALVDPLIQSLEQVGEKLTFCKPKIRLERATETSSSGIPFTSRFVPDHMRNPVFFHHAVQRLAQDYPSAIWLEAGSAAKITSMARRSVGTNSGYHFQGISLTDDRGVDQLTDTTLALWKEGLSVTYWAHYGAQAAQSHKTLLLPPYQFEKNRHWLDVKPIPLSQLGADLSGDKSGGLWTFMGYQDSQRRSASFKINTESERYKSFIMPHVAAQTASICPATLEYSMAIEALLGLLGDNPAFKGANLHPAIRNMRNEAPLCVNSAQSAWLELQANDDSSRLWSWKIVTTPAGQQPDDRNVHETMMCVEGEIEIFSGDASTEFSKFEQLATHKGCVSVLEDDEGADCGLQGRSVYRSLADVVDYGELYRRVRRVTGRGNESAGTVHSAPALAFGGTWLDDLPAIDSFSQVAGLWVNCMADRQPGSHDMFLATGCEVIMSAPGLAQDARRQPGKVWHVWAKHSRKSDRAYTTDVFVFDSSNGRLVEVFLGIQYSRIPKHSMSRVLVKLTEPAALLAGATLHANHATVSDAAQEPASSKSTLRSSRQILKQKVKDVISNVSGVDSSEINDDSELANLGIDSLAGMELARELEGVFQCHLDQAELLFAATSFQEFVTFVTRVVNGSDDEGTAEEDDDSASSALNSGDVSPNNYSAGTSVTHACSSIDGQSDDEAPTEKTTAGSPTTNLGLGQAEVLAAFAQVKASTDQRIKDAKLDDTDSTIVARSNRLCVALVVEAFEQLGCSLQKASPGQILERITHPPQHTRLVEWLYNFLERDARLIDIDGGEIKRTHNAVPRKSSETIFQELLQANDRWVVAHKVANYAGKNLADVVSGKKDGIHVLFGSPEGRDLVRGLYCDLPFNKLNYEQMRDTVKHIIERLPTDFKGPLRILEMGAGTGGTTYILAPYLATLDINVEYTFTDLSPSMVAQARRTFGKQYPFMRFGVHDIEKSPVESLCGNQHVVIASNAVHATADLVESSSNIRKAMHPDGILMLTEMTEGLPFVDLVFGLLEGWWRFADDRTHAIVPAKHWESRLQEAGYGHVDWTDGALPENRIQKVIFALAGKVSVDLSLVNAVSADVPSPHEPSHVNAEAREAEANKYVAQYSAGFAESLKAAGDITSTGRHRTLDQHDRCVVIITGATGSLGSHLVARFAEDPSVDSVVCINRTTNSGTSALQRQQESLSSRKVTLSSTAAAKLRVFATDTALPQLGLSPEDYTWLAENGTHIVHNAWPMSASRPLRAFQPQLQSLRRLLDLASDISGHLQSQSVSKRVCFQFVSSIGAVGLYQSSNARIPEERLSMSSVLPNGYCEAKWVCERLLDETLHRFPDRFRAMVIRPGQIAGSSVTGVWNPVEHFAFLIKSAQSLRSFPAFEGVLQWIPADAVASTLADLALNDNASEPAYHIDNPTGQPWNKMSGVLAEALNIPRQNLIPFSEWIRMVKRSTLVPDTENPALRLVEFLEKNFERMSCGGVILDTSKARQHSPTLAAQGPVSDEVARRYVSAWKEMGFLRS